MTESYLHMVFSICDSVRVVVADGSFNILIKLLAANTASRPDNTDREDTTTLPANLHSIPTSDYYSGFVQFSQAAALSHRLHHLLIELS